MLSQLNSVRDHSTMTARCTDNRRDITQGTGASLLLSEDGRKPSQFMEVCFDWEFDLPCRLRLCIWFLLREMTRPFLLLVCESVSVVSGAASSWLYLASCKPHPPDAWGTANTRSRYKVQHLKLHCSPLRLLIHRPMSHASKGMTREMWQ